MTSYSLVTPPHAIVCDSSEETCASDSDDALGRTQKPVAEGDTARGDATVEEFSLPVDANSSSGIGRRVAANPSHPKQTGRLVTSLKAASVPSNKPRPASRQRRVRPSPPRDATDTVNTSARCFVPRVAALGKAFADKRRHSSVSPHAKETKSEAELQAWRASLQKPPPKDEAGVILGCRQYMQHAGIATRRLELAAHLEHERDKLHHGECTFRPETDARSRRYVADRPGTVVEVMSKDVEERRRRRELALAMRDEAMLKDPAAPSFKPVVNVKSDQLVSSLVRSGSRPDAPFGERLHAEAVQKSLWQSAASALASQYEASTGDASRQQVDPHGHVVALPQRKVVDRAESDRVVRRLLEWQRDRERFLSLLRTEVSRLGTVHDAVGAIDVNDLVARLTKSNTPFVLEDAVHRDPLSKPHPAHHASLLLAEAAAHARYVKLFMQTDTYGLGTVTLEGVKQMVSRTTGNDGVGELLSGGGGAALIAALQTGLSSHRATSSTSPSVDVLSSPLDLNKVPISAEQWCKALTAYERQFGPQMWCRRRAERAASSADAKRASDIPPARTGTPRYGADGIFDHLYQTKTAALAVRHAKSPPTDVRHATTSSLAERQGPRARKATAATNDATSDDCLSQIHRVIGPQSLGSPVAEGADSWCASVAPMPTSPVEHSVVRQLLSQAVTESFLPGAAWGAAPSRNDEHDAALGNMRPSLPVTTPSSSTWASPPRDATSTPAAAAAAMLTPWQSERAPAGDHGPRRADTLLQAMYPLQPLAGPSRTKRRSEARSGDDPLHSYGRQLMRQHMAAQLSRVQREIEHLTDDL